jgi:hypothetical protein
MSRTVEGAERDLVLECMRLKRLLSWHGLWKRAAKAQRELRIANENTLRLQTERHNAKVKNLLDQWNRDLNSWNEQINLTTELRETNNRLRMHINEHAPGTLPPELR